MYARQELNLFLFYPFDKQKDFKLVDDCVSTLKNVAQKYNDKSGFNYDLALKNHLAIYQPQFNNVTLSLGKDNFDSNEKLLKAQKGKKEINSALAERTYYAGRYAYLCCSGYSTSLKYFCLSKVFISPIS